MPKDKAWSMPYTQEYVQCYFPLHFKLGSSATPLYICTGLSTFICKLGASFCTLFKGHSDMMLALEPWSTITPVSAFPPANDPPSTAEWGDNETSVTRTGLPAPLLIGTTRALSDFRYFSNRRDFLLLFVIADWHKKWHSLSVLHTWL